MSERFRRSSRAGGGLLALLLSVGALAALGLLGAGCAPGPAARSGLPLTVEGESPHFIAYGDIRFTPADEGGASSGPARRALVARMVTEHPAALFVLGDIPYRGIAKDYAVYEAETRAWRAARLRVFPTLGNHEFRECEEADCLERWWGTFPEHRGERWYAVALGRRVLALALDSDASLEAGSAQRRWIDATLAGLAPAVDFVILFLHHPPVADLQGGFEASHNPRSNERALADRLRELAPGLHARLLVCGAHVHNYERRVDGEVTYLVSGGGGARPVAVERDAGDLYTGPGFPNYHYLRFALDGARLRVEMWRLEDYDAAVPGRFERRDAFELEARPR
ncbi:MAG: metallophosphoesterase [Proteobacteria bacterium]|nr:metallophosphoesterase [Pseudomonadota bacterium]